MMDKRIAITAIGFLTGFLVLHPFSMVFQGLVHPVSKVHLTSILDAFNLHHLPMAFFFGMFGALFALVNTYYAVALTKQKERVNMLESLLPICSYCKKIRDDSGTERYEGKWHEADKYIAMKTDTTFTHSMCPDCYDNVIHELDMEDEACVDDNGQVRA